MKIGLASFERGVAAVLLSFVFLIVSASSETALAQTVVVRVANGRSGKPMPRTRLYIGFDASKGRQPLDLTTDRQGEVSL
jgi:hypothetical protein